MKLQKSERLGSLDVLRGFDLFCLVFLQPVLVSFINASNISWLEPVKNQLSHVHWEGFAFWDIIMPLFMFMAGASMPFAFEKYLKLGDKKSLFKRIVKRVLLLWIFGMMCQGNLLALDPQRIYFFSNTLQAIAIGYLFSSIIFIYCNRTMQISVVLGLAVIYWALLSFVSVGNWGGGNWGPDNNLAEYIDRIVLSRFRDGTTITESGINFGKYRYTWIISSLNFVVTVMSGVFAGQIMKANISKIKKVQWMLLVGVILIVAGKIWGLHMPIIKKIWTSSMTLYSSGICFILMAVFYYLVDYKNYGKYLNWLKIYGMNSILAYMLFSIINFTSISKSLFFGFEQYMGDYYNTLITLSNVSFILIILWIFYKNKRFLKV